jgi:hypothetical protein
VSQRRRRVHLAGVRIDDSDPRFDKRLSEVDPLAPFRLTQAGAQALAIARRVCRDEMLEEAAKSASEADGAAHPQPD